jgi:hypothetical protein
MAVMDLSPDTSREAHEIQVEAYRRMGEKGRAAATFSLIDLARRVAMAGIRTRHPEYTDEQVPHAYARLVLGDDLVRRVWPDRDLVAP